MIAGTCECGCGQATRIPGHNDKSKGWAKGVPVRFVAGHNLPAEARAQGKAWAGHRALSSHGYVRVSLGDGARKYEHVIVAEAKLGRPLRFVSIGHADNEIVHHIDGDKTNNHPDNLEVMTHGAHCAMHKPRKGTGHVHA